MHLITGLETHQAIEMDGKYIVQLATSYGRPYYEVNGQKAGSSQVVVDDLASIKKIIPSMPVLSHYTRGDGSTVSKKEVSDFTDKWLDYEDVDDGEMDFGGDVDLEVQYVKEKAQFKNLTPVYDHTDEVEEDVEITVVGSCEDTGSDFIETPFMYGHSTWAGRSAGVYKLCTSAVAYDQMMKIKEKYPDVKWSVPNHSHLKYVQVNGSYVFTKSSRDYISEVGKCKIYSTLEVAKQDEEAVRKFVTSELMIHLEPRSATDVQIKDFVDHLERIRNRVMELDVKVKSQTSRSVLVSNITKLMDTYKEDH